MNMFDVRKAAYSINRDDTRKDVQYRILAVSFSQMPVGQMFRRNVSSRFAEAIWDDVSPIIRENFLIDKIYGYCPRVDDLLSAFYSYGLLIGLRNWSPDFRYEVTEETHKISREIEDLHLFDIGDLAHIKGLGMKLREDTELVIPL